MVEVDDQIGRLRCLSYLHEYCLSVMYYLVSMSDGVQLEGICSAGSSVSSQYVSEGNVPSWSDLYGLNPGADLIATQSPGRQRHFPVNTTSPSTQGYTNKKERRNSVAKNGKTRISPKGRRSQTGSKSHTHPLDSAPSDPRRSPSPSPTVVAPEPFACGTQTTL